MDHNKSWKSLQEMGIPDYLTCLLRNLYAGQSAIVRTEHGTGTSSKLGKKYVKAVNCHPAYLTYTQSTSRKMPGWSKHKLESRLQGETSITSDMQMTPLLWQKVKRNYRASWWKWKRRVSAGLKLNIQKTKIMATGYITSWKTDEETLETVTDFIFLVSQNHCRWWL